MRSFRSRRRRHCFSRLIAGSTTSAAAADLSQASASRLAVPNSLFAGGKYVKANCSRIRAATPTYTVGLLNSPEIETGKSKRGRV